MSGPTLAATGGSTFGRVTALLETSALQAEAQQTAVREFAGRLGAVALEAIPQTRGVTVTHPLCGCRRFDPGRVDHLLARWRK